MKPNSTAGASRLNRGPNLGSPFRSPAAGSSESAGLVVKLVWPEADEDEVDDASGIRG